MQDCKTCGIAKLEKQLQKHRDQGGGGGMELKGGGPDVAGGGPGAGGGPDVAGFRRHVHTKPVMLDLADPSFRSYGTLKSEFAKQILETLGEGDLSAHVLKRGRVRRMLGSPSRKLRAGRPVPLLSPSSRLSLFPPVFDSRLFYRPCHNPLKIEDQGSCASCVFISAAYVAQIRANITTFCKTSPSAVDVWRRILEKSNDYDKAVIEFTKVMGELALPVAVSGLLPLLDWERFICCSTEKDIEGACATRLDHCYHHQDGDPDESVFTCEKSVTGVVPHHFVEWVARRGFHDRQGRLVISKIKPEGDGDSKVSPFSVTRSLEATEVDEEVALAIAEQIRSIKVSLMANGPLMVMMRIHGKNFDDWGRGDNPQGNGLRLGYTLPGSGQMDEYHEVMLVGWSIDDLGKPCWIIQNSYGPQFNDACAISPKIFPGDLLSQAYQRAQLGSGGFVFVRMVDTESIEKDIGSGLENNTLAFQVVLATPTIQQQEQQELAGAWQRNVNASVNASSTDSLLPYVIIAAVVLALAVVLHRYIRARN